MLEFSLSGQPPLHLIRLLQFSALAAVLIMLTSFLLRRFYDR